MRPGIGCTLLASRVTWAALLSASAIPAVAQDSGSVSDYRLPDPTQTARPQVQGPVDPENPYGAPGSPSRAQPVDPATPTPAPRISLPPPEPDPLPRAANSRATRAQPRPAEPTRATEKEPATPGIASTPSAPIFDAAPQAGPQTSPTAGAATASAPPAQDNTWLIAVVVAILAVGAAALLLFRRRHDGSAAPEAEAELVANPPASEPQPAPPARLASASATPVTPASAAPAIRPQVAAPEPLPLDITFTARAVRLSLVFATLQYELKVTNTGSQPLPTLEVCADLASAHASLDTRQQLAPDPRQLEVKHTVSALAPDEVAVLKGEVRVPLQQVHALVKGEARFMVPLARFCIIAPDGTGVRRVFTLGPRDPGSGAIASVRLDAGPRNLRELEAREIEAARGFVLDPVGA